MNTSRNSSSPHPSFRSYLYLAFYAFQVVLAYSPLLIRVAGPWTVLATFGFLFLFGLVLAKPVLLGRLRAPGSRTALWLSLAAIFFNLSLLLFGRHFALYSASPLFLALFAIPFVAALRSKAFLVGALAAALLTIHVSLIRTVPLDRSGGMLALIDAAAEALLSGRNPYRERLEVPIGDRGFIYVPGLLLAYLPFKAAGVDIRYLNAGAAVLFWLYVTLTGWRRKEGGWWRAETLLTFAILTSPNVCHLISTKHTFFYGVLLFLLTVFVGRMRATASSLLLGLVFVLRQFSVVLAPAVMSATRGRWLSNLAWLTVVVIAVFGPFMALDPEGFPAVVSGRIVVDRYDDVPVDWSLNYSPGSGNSFNLGHVIKSILPAWSSALTMAVAALLEAAVLLALVKGRLPPVHAMYFAYASYLAFTINFSDYMLWDNLCIGWAIGWQRWRESLT